MAEHRVFYRRRLPHWQPDGATLFVTFRLANSLPRAVIADLRAESYDHFVRDENELERIVWYVIHNPAKAGLVSAWESWPWTFCKDVRRIANPPTRLGRL
jgi:hypothetical protein